MIPFFRKIRKKLADDNKPLKYLRYAIGEIVLVMVGILLALQVSNWNEKRKQDANFDKLIDALENEIIENIHEANHEIVIMKEEDAHDLISFIEMLLKLIFEFPANIKKKNTEE